MNCCSKSFLKAVLDGNWTQNRLDGGWTESGYLCGRGSRGLHPWHLPGGWAEKYLKHYLVDCPDCIKIMKEHGL